MNQQHTTSLILASAILGFTVGPAVVARAQTTPANVDVPAGQVALGSVELPRRVMANGETLASGTYEVQVTGDSATPDAPGQLQVLERWVEFRQGDEVRGREVVSIVPQSEIQSVAKSAPPASGTSRVELLKGNDYLRVWSNQNNTHYIIHLVVG
ncbi:MAG: hypothetical protein OSB03_11115 [Vicinamibacterales bacterium]|nr:hypothetical protein [Vicinamibacterales bacterium]